MSYEDLLLYLGMVTGGLYTDRLRERLVDSIAHGHLDAANIEILADGLFTVLEEARRARSSVIQSMMPAPI